MQNKYIQLVPADLSLARQVSDYYRRNKKFLQEFEPLRSEEFFSLEHQEEILKKEVLDYKEKISFRFYLKLTEQPEKIIGIIGLNNVVWGAFCSAFLGYKLDEQFINQGYMSMAIAMLVKYAFEELHLHRIEANVIPRNKASLRVLEKNHFVNEGISKHYLNIDGVGEDHIHMVKINYEIVLSVAITEMSINSNHLFYNTGYKIANDKANYSEKYDVTGAARYSWKRTTVPSCKTSA